MITIEEKEHHKIGGNTSLFVSFDFNQEIVNILKNFDTRVFDKKTKTWELPLTSLSELIEILAYIDDITLKLLDVKNDSKDISSIVLNSKFKTKLFPYQEDCVKFGLKNKKFLLLDQPGLGKAISLDTLVLTNKGFVPMKDIKIGDVLYDEKGKECSVIATYNHKNLEMYRITFTDNTYVDCCKDHLWQFSYEKCFRYIDSNGKKKKTLKRIDVVRDTNWIVNHNWKKRRLVFPRCSPVQFSKKELPLHPYVMGCLLGDGSFRHSISLTSKDLEIVNKVNKLLPINYYCKKRHLVYDYIITNKENCKESKTNKIKDICKKLKLFNHLSYEKFVPNCYKYSSVEDRIELLRGLFDTDGYTNKSNLLSFCTTSKQLKDDVIFLVESLGGLVNVHKKQGRYTKNNIKIKTRLVYILTIRIDDSSMLVSLSRKKKNLCKRKFLPRRMIKSIEKIDTHEGKCITVNSVNSLYLIKDFIVTHNTIQMICLAQELKEREELEHCLIVCCVNSLKSNWEKEIHKHSDLDCVILGKKISKSGKVSYATISERCKQLEEPIKEFFVIVNIESIRSEEFVNSFKRSKNKFGMIVIDEVHKSSYTSLQGQNVVELDADRKIALTGTLIVNSPVSAYIPLVFIGKERKHNVTNFKSTFCLYGGFGGHQIVGHKNLPLLQEEIDSCSLRRTKDLLNIPAKNVIDEFVEMNDDHREFYDAVKKGIKEECDKIELKGNNLLSLVTRLRQASTCPAVLTTKPIEATKIERAIELVDEITSNGDKVVIVSSFKEPLKELENRLQQYKPLIGTGDIPDEEVSKNVDMFQNDEEHKVFLGTSSKIGVGLTLNKARYLICLDSSWTKSTNTQIEDRIHRVNNTQPVFIYYLWCENTIDMLIKKIVERKSAMSDYLVDNIINDDIMKVLGDFLKDM